MASDEDELRKPVDGQGGPSIEKERRWYYRLKKVLACRMNSSKAAGISLSSVTAAGPRWSGLGPSFSAGIRCADHSRPVVAASGVRAARHGPPRKKGSVRPPGILGPRSRVWRDDNSLAANGSRKPGTRAPASASDYPARQSSAAPPARPALKRVFGAPRPFHHAPPFPIPLAAPVLATRRRQAHRATSAILTILSRLRASSSPGMLSAPPPARARLPPSGGSSPGRSPACCEVRTLSACRLGAAWPDATPTSRADTNAMRLTSFPGACSGPDAPPLGSFPACSAGHKTAAPLRPNTGLVGIAGASPIQVRICPAAARSPVPRAASARPTPSLVALHAVVIMPRGHRLDAVATARQQQTFAVLLQRPMMLGRPLGVGQALQSSRRALLLRAWLQSGEK